MSRLNERLAKIEKARPAGGGAMPSSEDIAIAKKLSDRSFSIWLAETLGGVVTDDDRAFAASNEPRKGGAWASEIRDRVFAASGRSTAITEAWLKDLAEVGEQASRHQLRQGSAGGLT